MTETSSDLPIGAVVDATPAERPEAVRLEGRFCRIEKLDVAGHAESLWLAVKGHDDLWVYMGYGPFRDEPSFLRWVEDRAVLLDPFAYAVIDVASDRAIGTVTLMEIRPAMGVIEMGNIVYTPAAAAHRRRHRSAIPDGALRLRRPALPALRMEMQCAQRAVAAGGGAPRLHL